MSLIWIVNILSVFFLCVFFAGIVIPQILLIAFRRRLFDEPDERKIHQCVVPRLGGMAFKPVVFFSFVLLLAVNVSTGHDELLKEIGAEALPLAYAFCAIIMLYLVGIADDLIGVRYRAKFFIQIVCGIMLVAGGVELSDLHGMLFIHSMPSWISIPLTVFVTVFIINAINLIDGIDGLASGLCSIAFLFYGMTFIWFHQYLYAMLAFATLGVLIPFYYYFVVCCAIMGLSVPFYSGVQTALFQEKIKPEYLGRVFSLTGSIMSLAMPIGLILSGFFADRIGVNHWFLLSGVLIIGIAIACPMITEVRKLDLKQNS